MLNWTYLPILKWKQGERIALSKLTAGQREGMTPILELPPIKSAHDGAALQKALPEYLAKIGKDLDKTFDVDQAVGIDIRWVAQGYPKQMRLLAAICKQLARQVGCSILPVLNESALETNAEDVSKFGQHQGYFLRIQTPVVEAAQVLTLVSTAIKNGLRKRNLHIVVDQYSIVKEDAAQKFLAVRPYLDAAIAAGCASVTVAGGSFPLTLIGFKQGIFDIPRVEWAIWQRIQKEVTYANVRFADYSVTNPAPIVDVDPKQVNPSVAIRYAVSNQWKLFKAGGFKKGRPNQYRGLCQLLITDPVYSGDKFSYGDDCYDKAAKAKLGNGNPSSWRRDATSHHLALTVAAL
ncbi:MAG: hypothetical protein EPN46_10405 [Candidimonas sp.]|nr:MAG: hypothetical protein EPN77_16845 [Candidimonas sp.]TAM26676.1 MAG: hypothetical protein EPN62_01450 [Candidimonas sp.]TAM75383.1 MAG: hypothetical protein EPN46_10405 [Candidimonas sp.]